jgi:hypothetical protein
LITPVTTVLGLCNDTLPASEISSKTEESDGKTIMKGELIKTAATSTENLVEGSTTCFLRKAF